MLFNKTGSGSEELFEISGTFQAATNYSCIESEVESATELVASIVGRDVVEKAEDIYGGNSASSEEIAFLAAVRKPVAFMAIAMYSRLSGLSHGDTGRKIKVDDNEKIPFEWMVDRDDLEMRERFYRAMDALFSYLNRDGIPEEVLEAWHSSPAYKMSQDSIIRSLSVFESIYPVDSSQYMFYKMLPVIVETQRKLGDIIGEEKLQQLLDGDDCPSFRSQAVRYTVLEALVTAVERWSVAVFPLAIARRFSPTYQGNKSSALASSHEVDWYINKLKLQIKDVALELRTAISGNPYEGMELLPHNCPKKKFFTV